MNSIITTRRASVIPLLLILLTAAAITTTSNSFAQEQLEESDGLMTARINGEIFTTGQTITVSGTVEERDIDSSVHIQVVDPNGEDVKRDFATVTADNTFTFSFVAGEEEEFSVYEPMETSGNYRLLLTYTAPGDDFLDDDYISEIEFVFAYTHVEEQPTTQQQQGGQGTITTPQQSQQEDGPRRTVNVTALNAIIIQGLEQVQRLNNTLVAENLSAPTLGQLQSIQDTFMNLRGNLTGVTPLAQGEGLANNTTATTTTPSQPEPLQSQEEQQPPSPSNPRLIF
jgi:hypothetical protein